MRQTSTQLDALSGLAKEHGGGATITYDAGFGDGTVEGFAGDHLFVVEESGETIRIGRISDLESRRPG